VKIIHNEGNFTTPADLLQQSGTRADILGSCHGMDMRR
jgi:hypothetical protein